MNEFNETLWNYYAAHGRHDLPWRQPSADGDFEPYKILVSELMLQQTQVARVIPKYYEFLIKFPDLSALATIELGDVLRVWSGLGYYRRAKFLWQAAGKIVNDFDGIFPTDLSSLVSLPGIGRNTAGAILAYAFNKPAIFIETNVRTVYIHHFFADQVAVSDKELQALVEQTLDHEHPREFYWALMDYGSFLKQSVGNLSRSSQHYVKQSAFEGSLRQLRGNVLQLLSDQSITKAELAKQLHDGRLIKVLNILLAEELIKYKNKRYSL